MSVEANRKASSVILVMAATILVSCAAHEKKPWLFVVSLALLFGYVFFEYSRGFFCKNKIFLFVNFLSLFLVALISFFLSEGGAGVAFFLCLMISMLACVFNNNI